MTTENKKVSGAGRRTFGVELEILIPWLWDNEPDPEQEIANQLPPVLRLPINLKGAYDSDIISENEMVLKTVYDTITEVLRTHGLPAENIDVPDDLSSSSDSEYQSESNSEAGDYSKWGIKRDDSLSASGQGYQWYGVEIVSPVERASTESFQRIRYALDVLKSNYRVSVNPTCALHVHVGDGPELMPLDHVRRVAGLLWAADPLLACVHHPDNRLNYYRQSIRERSNLANGKKATDKDKDGFDLTCCNTFIGGEIRYGEEPPSWREKYHETRHLVAYEKTRLPGHFEPFLMDDPRNKSQVENEETPSLPSYVDLPSSNSEVDIRVEKYDLSNGCRDAVADVTRYEATRNRGTPRFAYPVYNPKEDVSTGFSSLASKAPEDIGVFAGVGEIYSCLTSCVIEWLLRAGERPNYNFGIYSCFQLDTRGSRPGTIEFREASGTLDGEWAETWARICVGLTHFAIHASVEDYLAVLFNIHRASTEGIPYDVLDLLDGAGLFAEATVVEKKLTEIKEEWGLKVMPNSEQSSTKYRYLGRYSGN